MKQCGAFLIVLLASLALGQTPNDARLLTARTVAVIAEVEYRREDKAKYDNQEEVNRILRIVEGTSLFKTSLFPHAPYRSAASDEADILVTIEESVALPQTVSIIVRDPDSNNELFHENRDVVELKNDIKRLVTHFLTHVEEKKAEVKREEEVGREQERETVAAAQAAKAKQQCDEEKTIFNQDIISTVIVQHKIVPPVTQDMTDHNQRCPNNLVVPEQVVNQYRADAAAKEAAERARAEQAREDEENNKVLTTFQQQVASAPFVPPVSGQMRLNYSLPVATGLYYIIPSDGKTDSCTFPPQEMRKLKRAKSPISLGVLDCHTAGRQDFFVVTANERFYLIQANKLLPESQRVGTTKDQGTTICFNDGGCQHVLAEVRLMPTDLHRIVKIPTPGPLTASYSADGLSFKYPQNWNVSKKVGGNFIEIVPPEGHIGTWYTHGIFVTHAFAPSNSPTTLARAFQQLVAGYEKQGRSFEAQQTSKVVGGREGLTAMYTAYSPISTEEKGHLILIFDGDSGYYMFSTFSPASENENYSPLFDAVLGSAQLDSNLYNTDIYSGIVHNQTGDKTAPFSLKLRNDGGKLSGCSGITEPLYGSGPLDGLVKNGSVTFTVHGGGFDLLFEGKSEHGKITGTYNVVPLAGSGIFVQKGDFNLEQAGSKPLLFLPCPTDREVNAKRN